MVSFDLASLAEIELKCLGISATLILSSRGLCLHLLTQSHHRLDACPAPTNELFILKTSLDKPASTHHKVVIFATHV